MTRTAVADILCIGAQRAMTSWLHHAMDAHPMTWAFPNFDPVTSTNKEAHYWDWNHKRGPDWFRVLMRPLDDALRSLDFTPEYAFLNDDQIAECHHLNPTAKIIYILRDPLARALSAIRMHTMWKQDNASEGSVHIKFDQAFLDCVDHACIQKHSTYAANVQRWRRHYPELIVLNYEDLRVDPVASMHRIFDLCDLDLGSVSAERQAAIDARAAQVIWKTPEYRVDLECLQFLHGATWLDRLSTAEHLGMSFEEGDEILMGMQ